MGDLSSVLIGAAVTLVLGVLAWVGHERQQGKKLSAEADAVTEKTPAEVRDLSVTTMEKVIENLSGEVDRQAARIRTLEESEARLISERDQLRTRVDELTTSVRGIQTELDALRRQLGDVPITD